MHADRRNFHSPKVRPKQQDHTSIPKLAIEPAPKATAVSSVGSIVEVHHIAFLAAGLIIRSNCVRAPVSGWICQF